MRKLREPRKFGADKMTRTVKIDRAFYEVDDETETYRYAGRNPDWKKLSHEENERNKKSIHGYTRILGNGRRKKFEYNKGSLHPR